MSGLDVNKEHILEMACIVTDANLDIVAEVRVNKSHTTLIIINTYLICKVCYTVMCRLTI